MKGLKRFIQWFVRRFITGKYLDLGFMHKWEKMPIEYINHYQSKHKAWAIYIPRQTKSVIEMSCPCCRIKWSAEEGL